MKLLSPRQVHLDFHTSGYIHGIGGDFDSEAFAKTFQEASVSSVTVFGRCHHGYLYYQSEAHPEIMHPYLERKNLMLEQIDALHAVGIRAPVYTTIQWDRYNAELHPEWLIRNEKGEHEGGPFTEPGFYQSLCVNTGYWDFLEAHMRELLTLLKGKTDGFFFDITGIRPCVCAACLGMMRKRGIDAKDPVALRNFAKESIDNFKGRMTALVREYSKDCTVFYNAGHIGPCTKASVDSYSHFELESLPSGAWGYLHFPLTARYARTLGKDYMGMNGKFHTEWGDFHSLKNLAALEFEVFRMLSFGAAASIGDQLEPRGILNPATYNLIGKVYKRVAQCEEWARPSVNVAEAAVITSEPSNGEFSLPESMMGAAQMLEELALQFDIIAPEADLSGYKLVILPEDLVADASLQSRLDAYTAAGGAIIACAKGGMDAQGNYPACFGAASLEENENYPDFVIAEGLLTKDLESGNEYVIYKQGQRIAPKGAKTILEARGPYFPRKGDKFCSHRYTPSAKGEKYPAALQNGNVILFAHPLFEQYRHNAPHWCKQLMDNAISLLLPKRMVKHDGPSFISVNLLGQPEHKRVNAHVLSYVPQRKSAAIDIIEERIKLRNVRFEFNLPGKVIKQARMVPEGVSLAIEGNAVIVPEIDGYGIVELVWE
ncbi:MAG: beta-galactosidase trimerization domain-containing protein [Defluviitaleaceae bacterium]|nr:beta-galactosidase trimerization domain-containing protein [Defluviitaleaceae bacterium]